MDFLRRNLFLIVAGAAGLGGIALAATGLSAMPSVVVELEKGKQLYDDLGGLQNRPVNPRSIEIEQGRIAATREDREKVFSRAAALYFKPLDPDAAPNYKPFVPGAFPNGNDSTLREFRKQYGLAMDRLYESLVAGQPATNVEIDAMQDKIIDEQYRAREKGLDSDTTPSVPMNAGPNRTCAGVLTKAGARQDAAARAHIAAARKIHCYVTRHRDAKPPNKIASLDFHLGLVDTGTVDAPFPEDVWSAQVGYWIQKDVIDAIVVVNNEAAKEAKERGDERWVGMMPVKDIISIRMSDRYVVSDDDEFAGAPASGFEAALPPGTANTVYTAHVSDEIYEVMQFSVKLVMDQRDILRLVEKLTTNSFHTLLRISYSAVPSNLNMQGKIYGSEPTVLVVMDFETVMLGEVFRPLMPSIVCEALQDEGYGMSCPEPSGEEDEG